MTQLLHDYVPGLKFGAKILGSEVLGAEVPFTFGKTFYVDYDNGLDTNDGLSPGNAFKTIAYAYSQVTSNNNDVIVLSAYSNHVVTSMLTVSKNRVHFIGSGVGFRKYGQRAKIYMGVTTATSDIAVVKNTGVGNTFANIKFDSENTLAQSLYTFAEGGEYTSFSNCEFYKGTIMDSDTAAEVILNGDSAQFYNCTFGSLATAVSGDKIRAAVRTNNGTVGSGLVCRDVLFDGCKFWKNAGGTTTAMVYISADADIERVMEFHDCQFIANHLGSTPAVAIASAATLTAGQVLVTGDSCAHHCTKIATATGILSGLPAKVATATIGIQMT